jgi:hypothetical protein
MAVAHAYPSQNSTPPWVGKLHLYFSISRLSVCISGWIVSMVESQGTRSSDYCKVLATYAKWCHTIWNDLFPGSCVPTTASIKVVTLPSGVCHGSSRHLLWVFTSLPHTNHKEEARRIREKYMHDLFGQLPDAPIYVEAVKQGGDWGRVKWGHCAETLTTMWRVLFSSSMTG